MALFTMVGLSSYSRPSELLRCRVFSLVKPSPTITEFWTLLLNPEEREDRSKVGEYDDSVAVDSPFLKSWAPPLLKQLASQDPDLPLWSFKVFSGDRGHGAGHGTKRSIHRPISKYEISPRCPKERELAVTQVAR